MMFSKIEWYLRRLASMTPPELSYRLKQRVQLEQDKLHYLTHDLSWENEDVLQTAWLQFQGHSDMRFFFPVDRKDFLDTYLNYFPEELNCAVQNADKLLGHRVGLFGNEFVLGTEIDWHRDPMTGKRWPQEFYGNINIRDGETVGGVKWIWELNRHYHLVTLGKAYYLTGDERYAVEICSQFESWIQANPPGIGVNWTSSLELAVRLINWIWSLALIRDWARLDANQVKRILSCVVHQADYIDHHLSAYSSANNHLVGEAAGLAIVGLTFGNLSRARHWLERGLQILTQECGRQIHPDGVPAEQAVNYLAFVLDFNLIVWRLAELRGLEIPTIWYQRLEAASEFMSSLMDSAGNMPALGDGDDAQVLRLDERPGANNYQSILTSAAAILKRPDFKAVAARWDEKNHWLLGNEGLKVFRDLPKDETKNDSRLFPIGGYCAMRADHRVIVFDCGPLGYLSTAAHGHADALSIMATIEDRPFLIDPGTYAYHEGGKWREYFRGTAAHNTVVIDGHNQSAMWGTFLWGRKANVRLLHWTSNIEYDMAIAEHDGYAKIGVIHRRTVLYNKPNWLIVLDRLIGKGKHLVQQFWHLSPETQVILKNKRVEFLCNDEIQAICMIEGKQIQTKIHIGNERPLQGWYSPRYGHLEPAPVMAVECELTIPGELLTCFYLAIPNGIDLDQERRTLISTLKTRERKVSSQ